MNPDFPRRIRQSIAECDRFIAKESPRSADLRPAAVQKTLDHAIAHRAKLLGMLDTIASFRAMLFCDGTYYVGLADAFVTVGKFGGPSFAVPRGHAWYDRIAECNETTDGRAVASYFGELLVALAD